MDLHLGGNYGGAIFTSLVVIFTIVTVLFVIGWRPVGLVIGAATLLSTIGAVALGYGIMTATNYGGIHLQQVRYVTQSPALLFYVEIIVGSLGAVLDETSDISVAIFQLNGGARQRFKAGMDIGRAVMGPLIAVLFMIFIADTFGESILWLRNGNSIAQTVDWVMGLGFAQSLISAFGIVLAVPITSGLAALFARNRRGVAVDE
ncbi:YibE/F family protein [Lacticaseibacillus thailandensis]|uniref:YibE/F family protein n=1 Tax=Lacticaseibacillus thailandensis TaxID=381741 RepID=UPI000B04EC68|nr:YibE/F family protein [Lacticaseibacillus thailandensis]